MMFELHPESMSRSAFFSRFGVVAEDARFPDVHGLLSASLEDTDGVLPALSGCHRI